MSSARVQHITIDERGVARIAGCHIPVSQIVSAHRKHSASGIVQADPRLTLSDVYAALAFYHGHRELIHAEIRESQRQQNLSNQERDLLRPLPSPTPPQKQGSGRPTTGWVEVTDGNYAELVEKATRPVLLFFTAVWCGPARLVSPLIDELATDYAGMAIVAKVNVDDSPATATKLRIASIPTCVIFNDGREIERLVGMPHEGKAWLKASLDRAIGDE
jgi:thioredoxin 1